MLILRVPSNGNIEGEKATDIIQSLKETGLQVCYDKILDKQGLNAAVEHKVDYIRFDSLLVQAAAQNPEQRNKLMGLLDSQHGQRVRPIIQNIKSQKLLKQLPKQASHLLMEEH